MLILRNPAKSCEIFCFDMTKRIVHNSVEQPGKVRPRSSQMLAGLHHRRAAVDFRGDEVEETGLTFVRESLLKARNAARCTMRDRETTPASRWMRSMAPRNLFGALRRQRVTTKQQTS